MANEAERAKAVKELRRALRAVRLPKRNNEPYSYSSASLNVLGCVLSLNRNWKAFAEPRVERFRKRRPKVLSLKQLRNLIRSYPTPYDFSVAELDYKDVRRARVLVGVTDFALSVQHRFAGKTEKARLRAWAKSVSPADYKSVGYWDSPWRGFNSSV